MNADIARQRRRWRIAAGIGGLLCTGGIVGIVAAVYQTDHLIETSAAPTPAELAAAMNDAHRAGFVIGAVGAVMLSISLLALSRLKVREDDGDSDLAPWK